MTTIQLWHDIRASGPVSDRRRKALGLKNRAETEEELKWEMDDDGDLPMTTDTSFVFSTISL